MAETPRRRFAWFAKPKQNSSILGGFPKFPEFPEQVQIQVLSFLDVRDLLSFSLVCCYGYTLSSHDSLWRPIYDARFPRKPAHPDPRTDLALCQKAMYAHRLRNPAPGDEIQCLWVGSFNLVSGEDITSYEGRAWWQAVVVRQETPTTFLIHYPQWDSGTWDEVVPKQRIRWPPATQDMTTPLKKGDVIELRCPSTFGRSPWLECVVDKVSGVVGTTTVDVGPVVVGEAAKRVLPRSFVRLVETKEAAAARKKALLTRSPSTPSPLSLLLSPTARRVAAQPAPATARAAVAAGIGFAGGLSLPLGPMSPTASPATAPARGPSLLARSFSFSGRAAAAPGVTLTPSPLSPIRPIGSALGLGRAPSSSEGIPSAVSQPPLSLASGLRAAPPGGSPAGVSGGGASSAASAPARAQRSAHGVAGMPSSPFAGVGTAASTRVNSAAVMEAEAGAGGTASTATSSHDASVSLVSAFDIRDFDLGPDSDGEVDDGEVLGTALAAALAVDGSGSAAAARRGGAPDASGSVLEAEGEGAAGAAVLGRVATAVAVPFVSATAVLARHGAYAVEPTGAGAGGSGAFEGRGAGSRPPGSSPEVGAGRSGADAGDAAVALMAPRPRAGSGGSAVLTSLSAMVAPAVGSPAAAAAAALPVATAAPFHGRERAPSFGGTAAFFPAPDPPAPVRSGSPGRGRVSPFSSRRRQLSFGERGGEVRRRACIIQ